MDPKDINFAAMPQTAINVVTKPAEFFQAMSKTGGYLEPLVFAVIMGLVAGVIQAVLSFAGLGPGAASGGGMMAGFSMILFMPIAAAIGSFIGGAILFVIWKLMGSTEEYEVAYRCGAYLMALAPITAIISAVPYGGGIINMAIYIFYLVTASVHVHNLPAQKAWLVFGIIGAIFALIGVYSEYKARNASSDAEKWRKMGEDMRQEYQDKAQDAQKSADEMQRQAAEMARKYQQQMQQQQEQQQQEQQSQDSEKPAE